MKNKLVLQTLKDIVEGNVVMASPPIQMEQLKQTLDILKKDSEFKDFKKKFSTVRDSLAKKANLTQEQASSLINYALHVEKE